MKFFINILLLSFIILSPIFANNEVTKKQVTVKPTMQKKENTIQSKEDKQKKVNKQKTTLQKNNKKTKDKQEITVQTEKKKSKKSEIPPVKEPNLKEDPKAVKMNADRLLYDDKTKISQLRGNVKIVYGDLIVKSNYAKSEKRVASKRRDTTIRKGAGM